MSSDHKHIIDGLKQQDRLTQKLVFEQYGAKVLPIILRYVKNEEDAKDVCVQGFYKVFTKIGSYNGGGSFEGWMKRIIINEALMYLRKYKSFNLSIEESKVDVKYEIDYDSLMDYRSLLKLLDLLPTGYRTVFSLYVLEGFKHREIAEQLGISINTSKSQLILARKRLQEIIKKKHKNNIA